MTTTGFQSHGFSGARAPGKDVRCGAVRDSMKTNVLIQEQYCEIGEMRRTQFNKTAPSDAFGKQSRSDHEGVRELIHQWKYHTPDSKAVPELDFKTMNKLAAVNGATGAWEQRDFRAEHPRHIKPPAGPPSNACAPALPSNKAAHPTFGGLSITDPADAAKAGDAYHSSLLPTIQGAYQDEWIRANIARSHRVTRPTFIPPAATLASQGHTAKRREEARLSSSKYSGTSPLDTFKMPRFLTVGPIVDSHRFSVTA